MKRKKYIKNGHALLHVILEEKNILNNLFKNKYVDGYYGKNMNLLFYLTRKEKKPFLRVIL